MSLSWLCELVAAIQAGGRPLDADQVAAEPIAERRALLGSLLSLQEDCARQREDKLFLESVFENIPDMIFIKEPRELRFLRFNRAGEELLGHMRGELLGRNDYDFFPREQADAFTRMDREVLAGREVVEIPEEPIQTAKKGIRTLHTRKIPVLGDGGAPLFLLGISEDITEEKLAREELGQRNRELKRARAALGERDAWLRVLLEQFPGAVWTIDASLRYTAVAGARAEDLGLGDHVIGRALSDTSGTQEESTLEIHRLALEGRPSRYEIHRHARFFEVCVQPLAGAGGGAIAVATDVTERRRLEEERVEARLWQAQKLESLGILAGGIAHDFNNLLMGMLGNSSLALHVLPEGTRAHRVVSRIEGSAQRAADLTRQMLAYSGRSAFVIEPLNLSELVAEMTELLRTAIPKNVQLDLSLAPDIDPVEGDVAQIHQVVMNLITNAADSIVGAGRIAIRTGNVALPGGAMVSYAGERLPGGAYVVLEVADTGTGMDRGTVQRMFDPFFTTKADGHGLGLAAALGIVRGHHGGIEVSSIPDKGTTIRVMLPVAEVSYHTSPPLPPATAAAAGGWILVVDDEAVVREVAREVLEDAGYRVMEASDGDEGVSIFRAHLQDISLVLLDLTMPRMNGTEVFAAMRDLRGDVPVLLSSGYSEQEAMRRFGRQGPAGFLQKPYRMDDLLRAIQTLV